MSMLGNLARIPEEVRLALHQNPEAITGMLYPDSLEELPRKPGFFSRLFGRRETSAVSKPSVAHILSEDDAIDIDKIWHVFHFLFTGQAWKGDFPQGFLVSCGEEIGNVDVGYGPARSFNPAQVKDIAAFLSRLDKVELKNRLDPKKMEQLEIYAGNWDNCLTPEEWTCFDSCLGQMTSFVDEAAKRDMAVLVYIN